MLHLHTCGPLSLSSVHHHKYFLTILDDFTIFLWIMLLKIKVGVSPKVQQFITMIQNQYNTTLKTLRTDNSHKFSLSSLYASKGINHQRSCVETP